MTSDPQTPESRAEFRDVLSTLLGGPWPDSPPPDLQVHERRDRGDHTAELISYAVEPEERVWAWLLRPAGDDAGPRPGVAVWHQHNNQYHLGKSEAAGFAGDPDQHIGPLLVREGCVVLCPDAAGFEDRRNMRSDGRLEGMAFERHLFTRQLNRGRSLAWKNILDCRRALDCLESLPGVDGDRLGCCGHSLGSTFTWLTGPWDERLKCMVGNCCMPSVAAIEDAGINHSFSNTIPGLLTIGDVADIVSLIAPRRLHLNFAAADPLNPVEFVRRDLPRIAAVYESMDAADAFTWWIDPEAEHEFNAEMKNRLLGAFREAFGL